ncbi:hypothetical protein GOL40_32315 [Sinorhizobium medicae]|nr:hypothetical protein [Sinorhizobium medicae]
MHQHRDRVARRPGAFAHFQRVTRSYRPRLFRTYAVQDLPRTENDLE